MRKERFEQRLFRILAQAGYSPIHILTLTPEELVEIPGITVPNIRVVLNIQNRVLANPGTIRNGRIIKALLKQVQKNGKEQENG